MVQEKRVAGETANGHDGSAENTVKKLKTATGTDASSLAKEAVSNGMPTEEANAMTDGKPTVLTEPVRERDESRVHMLDESMDLDSVLPHPVNGEMKANLRKKGPKDLLPSIAPPLDSLKGHFYNRAQVAIESSVYNNSSAIFVYESNPDDVLAFGASCKAWALEGAQSSRYDSLPRLFNMQNRAGAASIVSGYLAADSSSAQPGPANPDKIVSVLTNSSGLLTMAAQMDTLFAQSAKVIFQVAAQNTIVSPVKALYDVPTEPSEGGKSVDDKASIEVDASRIVSDYISVMESIRHFHGAQIIFSATIEETLTNAEFIYKEPGHFVHIFDGLLVGKPSIRLNLEALAALPGPEPMRYLGQENAETVYVGLALPAFELLLRSEPDAGYVRISRLRPWSSASFARCLGSKTRTVKVVEQSSQGQKGGKLYEDILTAVLEQGRGIRVVSENYSMTDDLSGVSKLSISAASGHETHTDAFDRVKSMVFYDTDQSSTSDTAPLVSAMFSRDSSTFPDLQTSYDNFTMGGIVRHVLRLSPTAIHTPLGPNPSEGANLIVVGDAALLKEINVTKQLKKGGTILINAAWQPEELELRLHPSIRQTLAEKNATIFVVDLQHALGVHENNGKSSTAREDSLASVALHIAFMFLYIGQDRLPPVARTALERFYTDLDVDLADLIAHIPKAFHRCAVVQGWANSVEEARRQGQTVIPLKRDLICNSSAPNPFKEFAEAEASRSSWVQPAWHLMFPEAYGADTKALRPDLPEKNYLITVSENRRLTPLTYDRNIFHIEFDIRGTGMTYEVGEALGIHGWNDAEEVNGFINEYGLHADEIVNFPSREDPSRIESRTIFQVLQQNLDIFGRPGKSFYGLLAEHATSVDEERTLRFFASAEGTASFKKRGDIDTVTFADVFREFKSARPSFENLLQMVSTIKPRHYSIASSIKAHPDSVHLLVVTVDWLTPSGTPRYGQCTRYLVGLQPGAKVMVSIKPSVMKMPPDDMQPIVMAGLGTGLAPFMAYLQERAYRKNHLGMKVGPMALYLGSRYRAMEFLYGEQLLAYEADGLLTILGLAFSRDQKKKVYIQHLMDRDAKILGPWLRDKAALTTLCGPTWPVPDFYQAMLNALESTGLDKEASEKFIEEAKENERYVLEVY